MKFFQNVRFMKADNKGLWVNFATYTRKDCEGPTVTLVPMIHVAEQLYLQEADDEIWCHDVVLLESGNVPQIKWLEYFYKCCARVLSFGRQGANLGHEEQSVYNNTTSKWSKPSPSRPSETAIRIDESAQGYPVSPRTVRFIKADIGRETSKRALREIPWWFWGSLPVVFMTTLVCIPFKLKRRNIIKTLMDGSPPQFGLGLFDRNLERFFDFVIRQRDENLCKILEVEMQRAEGTPRSICVQFGAGHMQAVHNRIINKLGYSLSSERWVLCMREDRRLVIDGLDCFTISRQRYLMRLGPHISEVRKKAANKLSRPASIC